VGALKICAAFTEGFIVNNNATMKIAENILLIHKIVSCVRFYNIKNKLGGIIMCMSDEGRAIRGRSIMPSRQFLLLAGSLFVSVVLVLVALGIANPAYSGNAKLESDTNTKYSDIQENFWKQEFASSTLAQNAADLNAKAQELIRAASTSNLTDTLGRSLLINYSAAQGQGLGGDSMTQDAITQQALAQIQNAQTTTVHYTASDIKTSPQTSASLHAYGNALIKTMVAHPRATFQTTMVAFGTAVDTHGSGTLSQLPLIQKDYEALAKDIANLKTPPVFASLASQLANNYADMGGSALTMQEVLSDPVKGLLGMQDFKILYSTNRQLFVDIGAIFRSQGILFSKDEIGFVWAMVMTPEQFATHQKAFNEQQQTQNTAR